MASKKTFASIIGLQARVRSPFRFKMPCGWRIKDRRWEHMIAGMQRHLQTCKRGICKERVEAFL